MNMLTDEVTVGLQRAPSTPRPYCVGNIKAFEPSIFMLWPEHVIHGFALFDTSHSITSGRGEEFADDVGKVRRM